MDPECVIKPNKIYKSTQLLEAEKELDNLNIKELDNLNIIINDIIHVFINMSLHSNSYIQIMNDGKKYYNKYIKLYFYKINSINFIKLIFVENQLIMTKIINIILYSSFNEYTKPNDIIRNNVLKFIKENNIIKYYIYY